jgi:hypothetical protein
MPVVTSFIDDLLPMRQEKVVKRSFDVTIQINFANFSHKLTGIVN